MKKLLLFLLILSSTNVFSQAFNKIPIQRKENQAIFSLNKENYKAYFGINPQTRKPTITFSGKTNFTYNSIYQEAELEFEIFSNSQAGFSFLLVNNYYDYSLGADLYIIENGRFVFVGTLSVGAYNKIGNQKMNYNSILPYISIVNTTEKTYFSFEVPLVVINPGQQNEQIVQGSSIHYTLTNRELKQNLTQ
jgi:hypothetical protein